MQKSTLDYVNDLPQAVPDFNNLLAVLHCEVPERPTLYEFFLNERMYKALTDHLEIPTGTPYTHSLKMMHAFHRAGYDYAMVLPSDLRFESGRHKIENTDTVSINEGTMFHDRATFEAYTWPDPDAVDMGVFDAVAAEMPDGMKIIPYGPSGVLENVIALVGYEPLCYIIADDPAFAQDIFDGVGSRLLRYYERAMPHPAVGACMVNDDWGFKTQTLLSTRQMRKYVFPWHKRIVATAHAHGKPAILHSCGHFERIMDDVVEDMAYDARHSFEDAIMPIETAYETYQGRIAQLGGIDVDFMCRADPEDVYQRARALLDQTASRGGYALGTGNSVPEYIPDAAYFAMLRALFDARADA